MGDALSLRERPAEFCALPHRWAQPQRAVSNPPLHGADASPEPEAETAHWSLSYSVSACRTAWAVRQGPYKDLLPEHLLAAAPISL